MNRLRRSTTFLVLLCTCYLLFPTISEASRSRIEIKRDSNNKKQNQKGRDKNNYRPLEDLTPPLQPITAENLFSTLSLDEIEYQLAHKEVQRIKQTWRQLQAQGYEIYGFFHTNIWRKHWRIVLKEQLYLLDGKRKFPTKKQLNKNIKDYSHYEYEINGQNESENDNEVDGNEGDGSNEDTTPSPNHNNVPPSRYGSLLSISSGLYLNVVGNNSNDMNIVREYVDTLHLKYRHKIVFNFNYTTVRDLYDDANPTEKERLMSQEELSCGEYPTVMAMRGFCRNFVENADQNIRNDALKRLLARRELQRKGKADGEAMGQEESLPDLRTNPELYKELQVEEGFTPLVSYPSPAMLMQDHTQFIQRGKYELPLDYFSSRIPPDSKKPNTVGGGKKAIIYYFHLKGSCCWKDSSRLHKLNPAARWREYMNSFNLEFPSICMRAIGKYHYSTCGVEYQDEHYSGNYWWTDCQHLASLPPLKERFNWVEAEYLSVRVHDNSWMMLAYARHCAYSMFTSNLTSLYDEEIKREKYLPRLWDLVVRTTVNARRLPMTMQQNAIENVEILGKMLFWSSILFDVLSLSLSLSFFLSFFLSLSLSGMRNFCRMAKEIQNYIPLAADMHTATNFANKDIENFFRRVLNFSNKDLKRLQNEESMLRVAESKLALGLVPRLVYENISSFLPHYVWNHNPPNDREQHKLLLEKMKTVLQQKRQRTAGNQK